MKRPTPQPVPETCPELAGLLIQEEENPVEFAEAKVQARHKGCHIQRSTHGANHFSFLVLDSAGEAIADYDLHLPYHPSI